MYANVKKLFTSFFGAFAGLLFFIIGIGFDYISDSKVDFALLIGFFSLFLTYFLDRYLDKYVEIESAIQVKDLQDTLRASVALARSGAETYIELMGTAEQAMPAIHRRLSTARIVKNTFVQSGTVEQIKSSNFQNIIRAYQGVLARSGTEWNDIVSANELLAHRYQEIFRNIGRKWKVRGVHKLAVLRHNMPLLNFILISDKNGILTEVFFGWMFADGQSEQIFRSRHVALVETFDSYFKLLTKTKLVDDGVIEVDYSQQGLKRLWRSSIVDRRGLWLTVSFAPSGERGIEHVVDAIGLIRINFRDGRLELNGNVFEANGNRHEVQAIKPIQTTNRIFFDYRARGDAVGFCTYQFMKKDDNLVLAGLFANSQKELRIAVHGIKILDESSDVHLMSLDTQRIRDGLIAVRALALPEIKRWRVDGHLSRYFSSADCKED